MHKISLPEIQAKDGIEVAVQKARDAFDAIKKPLFINDASWLIPALNGFPGPYMRYIVEWFDADDLLALIANKDDRTIILRDTIVYKDENIEKVFTNDVQGTILKSPTQGEGPFITKLVSFEDDGKSLAEMNTVGYSEREMPLWRDFANWVNGSVS